MLFKQIIGQERVKEKLIQTINEKRVSHAQLFLGPEGSGNMALALAYAQYVSCDDKKENDSCGVCPSCRKYQKLAHPDLHFVFPVATSKKISKDPVSDNYIEEWRSIITENPYVNETHWYAKMGVENKQGIISKNESHEIIRKLSLKTFESEYKVMIIWLPEKMNAFSANKLLKLIEEPPEKTLFLCVSENSERILPTILSRMQMVKIPKVNSDDIFNSLCNNLSVDEKMAKDITHLANGNYLKALELIKSTDENTENFDRFANVMRMAYKRDILGVVEWADGMHSLGRENQKNFLKYCLRMIRENFMMNLSENDLVYLTQNERQFSEKFSPYINTDNVFMMTEEFNKAASDIEMNAYGKLVFLDLSLKLVKLIKP